MKAALWKSAVAFACVVVSLSAGAYEAGDFLFRAGAHYVDPKSNNNDMVNVDSDTMLTFDFSYFLTDNWAVELLAAAPFEHDINLNGGPKVGSVKHLPPTVSVQYHFNTNGRVKPFLSAGINMTIFFDEKTTGPLAGLDLDVDTSSFGPAAQTGVDVDLTDDWFMNASLRWMNIETDARLRGPGLMGAQNLGTVEIDPWLYGVNVGYRF